MIFVPDSNLFTVRDFLLEKALSCIALLHGNVNRNKSDRWRKKYDDRNAEKIQG
jgi:hypothetical protein